MRAQLPGITLHLKNLGHTRWSREIRECFERMCATSLVSPVQTTIKPPGQLAVRIIHASSNHPLEAVAKIVHLWLSEVLGSVKFLCRDAPDVIQIINNTKCSDENVVLLNIVVKEFYMSGEHDVLISSVLKHVPVDRHKVLGVCLWLWLRHQNVGHQEHVCQVMEGSGTGTAHSGALADLALWSRVESKLCFADFVVQCYIRFRDDIFVVAKSSEYALKMASAVQTLASPSWKLDVGECNGFSSAFFEVGSCRACSWTTAHTKNECCTGPTRQRVFASEGPPQSLASRGGIPHVPSQLTPRCCIVFPRQETCQVFEFCLWTLAF